MNIGEYVKQLRDARVWSLEDLRSRSTVSKGHLSEIERGNADPSLSTLIKIAHAFCMDAGDLLVQAGYTRNTQRETQTYAIVIRVHPDGTVTSDVMEADEVEQ